MSSAPEDYASSDDESYEMIGSETASPVPVPSIVEKKEEEETPVAAPPPVLTTRKVAAPPVVKRTSSVVEKKEEAPEIARTKITASTEVRNLKSLVAAYYREKKKWNEENQLTPAERDAALITFFSLVLIGSFTGCLVLFTANKYLTATSTPIVASEDVPTTANLIREYWNVPSESLLPIDIFHIGHRIRIVGVAKKNARRFSFDLEKGADIGFHFNPRFYQNCVVRNHAVKGEWNFSMEEIDGPFPFKLNEVFTVEFVNNFHREQGKVMITVLVNGKEFTNFPVRRPSFIDSTHLAIRGDVAIHSVQEFRG